MTINVWDRDRNSLIEEKIFADRAFRFLYETHFGYWVNQKFLKKPWFSQLYGDFQNHARSLKRIPTFIDKYEINMADFEEKSYQSFNDFFSRKFKNGVRPFDENKDVLPAPCEGRARAFTQLNFAEELFIKKSLVSPLELIGAPPAFETGAILLFRLSPVDYHRFHFPETGNVVTTKEIGGHLDSVHPLSLKRNSSVFFHNKRTVTHLKTENFGQMYLIEVGGFCVGRILQTYPNAHFTRGQEKGYFEFGGSTVVLIGEKNRWLPDDDLIEHTQHGRETFIKLGTKVGYKI